MSDRWQLGSYTFVINPNKYGESGSYIGDNAVTLDGTLISQPTVVEEQYNFSSTLYQGMPRILSQVSVPNGSGIEIMSGNYYILNNNTKNIDKYNSNLALLSSTALSSTNTGQNYTSFDVDPSGNFYAVEDLIGGQYLHTVTSSSKTFKTISNVSGVVKGIKYDSGNLWLITDKYILYQTDTNFNIINQVTLPYIDPAYLGYKGMTIIGNYLVLVFNSSDITGVYHIDKSTGIIANAFSLPNYTQILDVAYDGQNFVFITNLSSQLVYTNGNTLLADVYTIESNIRNNGYLYMIDDMGVNRKVTVSNYSIDRQDGYLTMYNIQLTVSKIDRG